MVAMITIVFVCLPIHSLLACAAAKEVCSLRGAIAPVRPYTIGVTALAVDNERVNLGLS